MTTCRHSEPHPGRNDNPGGSVAVVSPRPLGRRLTSLLAALAGCGAPALVLRVLCVGRSCEDRQASAASVPFCPLPVDVRTPIVAGFRAGRSPDVMATTAGVRVVEPPGRGGVPWPSQTPPDLRVPIAFWARPWYAAPCRPGWGWIRSPRPSRRRSATTGRIPRCARARPSPWTARASARRHPGRSRSSSRSRGRTWAARTSVRHGLREHGALVHDRGAGTLGGTPARSPSTRPPP